MGGKEERMSRKAGNHTLTVDMSQPLKSYHNRKRNVIDDGKKAKEEAKDNFLFDDKLHEEMSKCVLGYNPYQE